MDLEVYVQRRGGLDISSATGVFDALERSGSAVDRKGVTGSHAAGSTPDGTTASYGAEWP